MSINSHSTTTVFDWRTEFKRLEGAYAPATMRSYYSDLKIFQRWCEDQGVVSFPASVSTVCSFLEEQAPDRVPSTVRRRLYSIRKAHRLLRLPDPTRDEDINLTIRRIRRSKFARPKQAKALNGPHRDQLLEALPNTPWGLRDRVILSLGYDILARRSELVALKTSDITFRDDGTARVIIRRSKTDQFGAGRFALTSRETASLLKEWLAWRGEEIEYLICPIYKGIPINRGTEATIVRRAIKRAARLAGYDHGEVDEFSGHSMRVGAAQDLLCAGHDTVAIMRAGGWKSVEVLARYLEGAEHNVWI